MLYLPSAIWGGMGLVARAIVIHNYSVHVIDELAQVRRCHGRYPCDSSATGDSWDSRRSSSSRLLSVLQSPRQRLEARCAAAS